MPRYNEQKNMIYKIRQFIFPQSIKRNKNLQRNEAGFELPPDKRFKILPDKPIEPDKKKDIRFGHNEITNTILQLIRHTTPPLTIGLYGSWGSGKTTIAKSVEDKIKTEWI